MRTTFFFLAMLASISAKATVTVTPLGTDYATKKVTFKVVWTNSPTAPYNNRVWIWIDFCPVSGVTPQSFSTATISKPAKTAGNGTITGETTRGFFIEYAAINAGTTVTATLSNAPAGKFNWCAYGSDMPPNVTLDKGTYTFKGTTNFIVNTPAQTITTKTIAKANVTITSSSTFTDATGCPGIGSLYCPYTGSDLYMDATHLCQQRTSGAKNWEAWIKDTRDNELYRIVYMPDDKWWLAQNVKLASYGGSNVGAAFSNCNKDECGRGYTRDETIGAWGGTSGVGENKQGVCPSGWILPTYVQYQNLFQAINPNISWNSFSNPRVVCRGYYIIDQTVATRLHNEARTCDPGNDYYGWAITNQYYDCPADRSACRWHWTAQTDLSNVQYARWGYRDCYAYYDCQLISVAWIANSIGNPASTNAAVRCISLL
jgi:uncharacterized protein (TIGR02145 family)